jgi:hypothetical protein
MEKRAKRAYLCDPARAKGQKRGKISMNPFNRFHLIYKVDLLSEDSFLIYTSPLKLMNTPKMFGINDESQKLKGSRLEPYPLYSWF